MNRYLLEKYLLERTYGSGEKGMEAEAASFLGSREESTAGQYALHMLPQNCDSHDACDSQCERSRLTSAQRRFRKAAGIQSRPILLP